MATQINRLYRSQDEAMRVIATLRRVHTVSFDVRTVTPALPGDVPPLLDDVREAVALCGIPPAETEAYAREILGGAMLVSVDAGWGSAATAIEIMDETPSLPCPVPAGEHYRTSLNEAGAFSDAMGWPTLADDRAFISNFVGTQMRIPVLWRAYRPFSKLMERRIFPGENLIRKDAPFRGTFGLPLLLDKPFMT